MVYKVYGKVGKGHLFSYWKKEDELGCIIDGTPGCFLGDYIFNYKDYNYEDIKEFFDVNNSDGKLIYLYSNSTYEELKDFINFLETLKHNFILFIQE